MDKKRTADLIALAGLRSGVYQIKIAIISSPLLLDSKFDLFYQVVFDFSGNNSEEM